MYGVGSLRLNPFRWPVTTNFWGSLAPPVCACIGLTKIALAYAFACRSARPPAYLPACLPVCLPACVPACLPACLPACVSLCLQRLVRFAFMTVRRNRVTLPMELLDRIAFLPRYAHTRSVVRQRRMTSYPLKRPLQVIFLFLKCPLSLVSSVCAAHAATLRCGTSSRRSRRLRRL